MQAYEIDIYQCEASRQNKGYPDKDRQNRQATRKPGHFFASIAYLSTARRYVARLPACVVMIGRSPISHTGISSYFSVAYILKKGKRYAIEASQREKKLLAAGFCGKLTEGVILP
jgi:hypothetical protein